MESNLHADSLVAARSGPNPRRAPGAAARREAQLGLYVHVPFCARRCSYCDFSTGAISAGAVERYLQAMAREASLRAPEASDLSFTSVFVGGGTPSVLSARHFRRLWSLLRAHFALSPSAEITLEANPESVNDGLLEAWAEAGVNRLSMGAQSFDPDELVALGRIHAAERPVRAVALARAHGFRRLSIDLMFGFPGNHRDRWRASIESALALDLEHLSAYCFIAEPGTTLGDAVLNGAADCPSADEQAEAYADLGERLLRAGYACYETSNYCRPGAEARHNLVYWLRRPYLGLGPSAHGLFLGRRYGNHYALARWAAALDRNELPESELEAETEVSVAREIMMLGLRLGSGIEPGDYLPSRWDHVLSRYRHAFAHAIATGRLERSGHALRIPEPFRFVADEVIAWIEAEAERGRSTRVDSGERAFLPSSSCPIPHFPAV